MTKKIITECIALIPIEFQIRDLIEEHELLPDDTVIVQYDDDGDLACYAYRDRLETDTEYEKRIQLENFINEDLKKRRYENYLKLKEEFENNEL